jgi:hypothetical protein
METSALGNFTFLPLVLSMGSLIISGLNFRRSDKLEKYKNAISLADFFNAKMREYESQYSSVSPNLLGVNLSEKNGLELVQEVICNTSELSPLKRRNSIIQSLFCEGACDGYSTSYALDLLEEISYQTLKGIADERTICFHLGWYMRAIKHFLEEIQIVERYSSLVKLTNKTKKYEILAPKALE